MRPARAAGRAGQYEAEIKAQIADRVVQLRRLGQLAGDDWLAAAAAHVKAARRSHSSRGWGFVLALVLSARRVGLHTVVAAGCYV